MRTPSCCRGCAGCLTLFVLVIDYDGNLLWVQKIPQTINLPQDLWMFHEVSSNLEHFRRLPPLRITLQMERYSRFLHSFLVSLCCCVTQCSSSSVPHCPCTRLGDLLAWKSIQLWWRWRLRFALSMLTRASSARVMVVVVVRTASLG